MLCYGYLASGIDATANIKGSLFIGWEGILEIRPSVHPESRFYARGRGIRGKFGI